MVMWNARLRDPDLNLLDEIKFSSLTLVKTYNAPATLAVTGRLDNVRALLQPGWGVVVSNSDGQQFSGRLTSATRRGDGTATALYTGDLARLWDRVCYASPGLAWENQINANDKVTGKTEDRILSFVNRNAGPAAWHSDITGTDPGEDVSFTPYKTIVPDDRTKGTQSVVVDPVNGDLYMAQIDSKALYMRRLDSTGVQLSTMTLPKGGHGDVVYLTSAAKGDKRQVYLTFRYGAESLSHDKSGTWIRLPYTKDTVKEDGTTVPAFKATAALAYKVTAPVSSTLNRRAWCQGEATYNGYTFRLYGTPYTNTGSTVSPAIPAFVEVIYKNKIQRTVPAAHLARAADALPYDGRLEPEGCTVAMVAGQPSLIIGFCTGTSGTTADNGTRAQRLYSLPLKPAPRAAADRRIPDMRMPASLARGRVSTTTATFDTLGPLVAKLAESADLALNLDHAYDGRTPYLKFSLTDVPDLSGSIRVGPADAGGPILLGNDWSYTDAIPTVTTGLSVAGNEGSERILRDDNDALAEASWNARVEGLVDQKGTTDLSEISDGIDAALLAGTGLSEISVPLGRSALKFGTDIPLGAKIVAILDGQPVVERVRQITITVGNTSGSATETLSAILGSPDTALKTPTQKALAAMLRRVQHLERT